MLPVPTCLGFFVEFQAQSKTLTTCTLPYSQKNSLGTITPFHILLITFCLVYFHGTLSFIIAEFIFSFLNSILCSSTWFPHSLKHTSRHNCVFLCGLSQCLVLSSVHTSVVKQDYSRLTGRKTLSQVVPSLSTYPVSSFLQCKWSISQCVVCSKTPFKSAPSVENCVITTEWRPQAWHPYIWLPRLHEPSCSWRKAGTTRRCSLKSPDPVKVASSSP